MVLTKAYSSWHSEKAVSHRQAIGFPSALGTAIILQQYLYDDHGVLSTRSPTGQSQDIDGILTNVTSGRTRSIHEALHDYPIIRDQLYTIKHELEVMFKDMQDVEFAIRRDDVVFVLQSKAGYRTSRGSFKIAVAMVAEGILTERMALMIIDPIKFERFIQDDVDAQTVQESEDVNPIAQGEIGCRSGCISGTVVFSPDKCVGREGLSFILVTNDCSVNDHFALKGAAGVVLRKGAAHSEAAELCRGLGKPCIVQTSPLNFEYDKQGAVIGMECGNHTLSEGSEILLDSENGFIYAGFRRPHVVNQDSDLKTILQWSAAVCRSAVYASAETIAESSFALHDVDGLGSLDIDFNSKIMIHYLVSKNSEDKAYWLDQLHSMLKTQYTKILRFYHEKRVIIRAYDRSPLEYLPVNDVEAAEIATSFNLEVAVLRDAALKYAEIFRDDTRRSVLNMIVFPEIFATQMRAIFDTIHFLRGNDVRVLVDVSFSNLTNQEEFKLANDLLVKALNSAGHVFDGGALSGLGIIVSTPQQCFAIADLLASPVAQVFGSLRFITFDVKSLTLLTLGLAQTTASKVIAHEMKAGVLAINPLRCIDNKAVGHLIELCARKCKVVNSTVKTGVDLGSIYATAKAIYYFHDLEVDYLTCDAYKAPLSRLLLAQATIDSRSTTKRFELDPSMLNVREDIVETDPLLYMQYI